MVEREGVGEGIFFTQACTNEWLGLVDGKDLLIWGIETESSDHGFLSFFFFERGEINCAVCQWRYFPYSIYALIVIHVSPAPWAL